MHIALFEDNSMMTRLHYYDYSRLMGATYLDFIDNYGDMSQLIDDPQVYGVNCSLFDK